MASYVTRVSRVRGIQLKVLSWRGQFEDLLDRVRPRDHMRLSRPPTRRDVLDRFGDEGDRPRFAIRGTRVLVDEPLDLELSEDDRLASLVEAEDLEMFGISPLGVLAVGG
jgi:hypothetical protein